MVAAEHEAQSAIKRAQQEPFDVYILDIGLPGINGYELAHELRALPGCERAVFVAHAGYGQEEDKRMSAEARICPSSRQAGRNSGITAGAFRFGRLTELRFSA